MFTVEVLSDGAVRSVYSSPNGAGVYGGALPTGPDGDGNVAAAAARCIHPDDQHLVDAWHAQLRRGEPAEMECRFVGLDGRTRWVWTRGQPRRIGARLLIDGICTNVTERRELAEQREAVLARERRAVEELQALDRLKNEFVATMTHELRGPSGVMSQLADVLAESPALADNDRRLAASIRANAEHMSRVVDDLRDLARFDAGRPGLLLRRSSLSTLCADLVNEHGLRASAKDVEIALEADDGIELDVDAVRIRQAVGNLLSNAIAYTPAGGRVVLELSHDGTAAVVRVRDTGMGIPAEDLPQLFTRFFRASNAYSPQTPGTGLGLSVARTIVEAHGGRMAVTSSTTPGRSGTVFTIRLPFERPQDER